MCARAVRPSEGAVRGIFGPLKGVDGLLAEVVALMTRQACHRV